MLDQRFESVLHSSNILLILKEAHLNFALCQIKLYNFEKANDEMASKLRVLDSSIHEIKSSSVVSL